MFYGIVGCGLFLLEKSCQQYIFLLKYKNMGYHIQKKKHAFYHHLVEIVLLGNNFGTRFGMLEVTCNCFISYHRTISVVLLTI